MIGSCVIDASASIKLFLREEGTDVIESIFAGLNDEPPIRLIVPDLFYTECANILWKYVWRFGYAAEDARSDLRDLLQLKLDVVNTSDLLTDAFALAVGHGLSFYDACYVALSMLLELPLVTADERLANKLLGKPFDIRLLSDLSPPAS